MSDYKDLVERLRSQIIHSCVCGDAKLRTEAAAALSSLLAERDEANAMLERETEQHLEAEARSMAIVIGLKAERDEAERLVTLIHETVKRGDNTDDHGLIGNLTCILDHVSNILDERHAVERVASIMSRAASEHAARVVELESENERLRKTLKSLLDEMRLKDCTLRNYDVYHVSKGEVQLARAALRVGSEGKEGT